MKRIPRILLLSGMVMLIVIALLISGLRLVLPHINHYRPQLLAQVEALSGIPVQMEQIQAGWKNIGPTLVLGNVAVVLPNGQWKVERITLALDIWQSLLHLRWQLRDLTFYRLQADLGTVSFKLDPNQRTPAISPLEDLLLRQLSHFNLRDSRIFMLSPSGSRIELTIPHLTWLNGRQRHRAEGQIQVSSLDEQYGVFQLRMDLRDKAGLLDQGMIYLQADDVNMKPWLSQLLRDNTGLDSAHFNLASWLQVDNGVLSEIRMQLQQGKVNWHDHGVQHRLDVDDVLLQAQKNSAGDWQLDIPRLNFLTDGRAWPPGRFSMLWLPKEQQIRVRATALSLPQISPLLSVVSFLSPEGFYEFHDIDRWQLRGELDLFALDIPLQQPESALFRINWRDVAWQQQNDLWPGMSHFSGQASGSLSQGAATIAVGKGTIPYGNMFRARLEIEAADAGLRWRYSEQEGLQFWSDHLAVKARSLWVNGCFNFEQSREGKPYLGILAGIRLYDVRDAWRYFPEPLMGTRLTDYLSGALQGGSVDNATLIYAGDPQQFPFSQRDGLFQVWVPLRQATFQYETEWPALDNLSIDLNFLNDGLWMSAPLTYLGEVRGTHVQASIPQYKDEKLLIEATINGSGPEIHDYFKHTPLKGSVGMSLDELTVTGEVSGRLHLDIPLDGKPVDASGSVFLKGNRLVVGSLNTTFDNVSGEFRFRNGDLLSDPLSAHWFGLPVTLDFSTQSGHQEYQIKVGMQADWPVQKFPLLADTVAGQIAGKGNWRSHINISLPYQDLMRYNVDIFGDLSQVTSQLPAPLEKMAESALPITLKAEGDKRGFTLSGSVNQHAQFNSQWLLEGDAVRLVCGNWNSHTQSIPPLPTEQTLLFNLPTVDGAGWLALLDATRRVANMDRILGTLRFPQSISLDTASLNIGGQLWQKLNLSIASLSPTDWQVSAKGREIAGQLQITEGLPWRLDLAYLYYNPQHAETVAELGFAEEVEEESVAFKHWPNLQFRCQDCWLMGQRLRQVQGDLRADGHILTLENGLIDTGNTRLDVSGEWRKQGQQNSSRFSGKLSGSNIGNSAEYVGVTTPLSLSPFNMKFALQWQGVPWQPQLQSLNGKLDSWLGKGELVNMSTGRAGQLLRLVSVDALLRKLRFDFSDTFGQSFYFDSIQSNGEIKQGIITINDLVVDGLEADISMTGTVDLIQRQLQMQAVVAPELSTTVGVTTAFVVNPIAGAAVFVVSKVLGPLWSKISLIRYQISGSLDQPKVSEILRQPKELKAQ